MWENELTGKDVTRLKPKSLSVKRPGDNDEYDRYSLYTIPADLKEKIKAVSPEDEEGIYLYIGTSDKPPYKKGIYVGQSVHWTARVNDEHRKEVDKWVNAHLEKIVVFSPDNYQWNRNSLDYIERKFYAMARDADKYKLYNAIYPPESDIRRPKKDRLDRFIGIALAVLSAMGLTFF